MLDYSDMFTGTSTLTTEGNLCRVDKSWQEEKGGQFRPKIGWHQLRTGPWGQCSRPVKLLDSLKCNILKCGIELIDFLHSDKH